MNKKTEIRICPYCQKEFEIKTNTKNDERECRRDGRS